MTVRDPADPARVCAVLRQAASVLLGYPDEAFFERLPVVYRALLALPDSAPRADLTGFCDHAASTPELELGAHYVATFDLRRRRTLHLTYYTDGDTRRRGHALAEVKAEYAACGWELEAPELPDHLAVLLEFAARGDARRGEALLVRFQPGLELLRAALRACGTPYAAVLDAVAATLPAPHAGHREAVRRLAAAGPPAEEVGLAPYGGPVPLGMPGPRPGGAPAAEGAR
ncbi:nitrate reductase molybdenum cofactor assembly chaperone [Nocardiopsis trehalosi]|jgi:nitrate reductase delta subunit|uniref:nitrate reductase molybdenum cofactor assembly chaperone n=1 Tax=Nocardiopsis trehalosi TaxID=109329 RepID=UPI00082AE51D|nr:nitrate reductase molybdenum cofactor assembly chaperone [Nocardiopsis trehalosi]